MTEYPRPVGTYDCRCGRPAMLLQSHTPQNPNRWFFKCNECNFFKFADTVPGYPTMPSVSGNQQQQHSTQTPQRSSQQEQQITTPTRVPRYSEPPAGAVAYSSPGGAEIGGPQHQEGYTQQQSWPQQSMQQQGTGWQQQTSPMQQPPHSWNPQQQTGQQSFSPQQPQQYGWQQAPTQQQQQQWTAPPQYGQGQLGQQILQQGPPPQQQQQQPYQGYGSQGSGSQGGTQGSSQGGGYSQQPSQQQQPASQWQQPQQSQQPGSWQPQSPQQPSASQWQQPQQQQHWQPQSPQGQQQWGGQQQPPPQWQQQQPSPLQQQAWSQQQQPPQAYASPVAAGPAGYQQQQQPFASPGLAATSPMGAPGSGFGLAPAAAAVAASPGKGVTVKVYPAPASYNLPHHLVLNTSGYSRPFVDCIKQLDWPTTDRKYRPDDKVWTVFAKAWEQVKQHLEANGFTIKAQQGSEQGANPPGGLEDLAAIEASDARLVPLLSAAEAEGIVSAAIPPECWDQLMTHQQQGVLAGVRRQGRVLLADEMGLGKTAQAVVLACCYPQHWPLLVIIPASLRGVWSAELQAWITPDLMPAHNNMHIIKSGEALKRLVEEGLPATREQVLVITYDLVKKLPPQTAARFGVVICDESHHLKNKDAQRTQAVSSVVRGAAVAVLLTGTPLLSRPIEVWSQVDMLRPGLLGSFDQFGKKYCVPEGQAGSSGGPAGGSSGGGRGYFPGQQYYGCNKSRIDELHRLLLANVMVRRTKAQVGLALPAKTRMKVSVSLDPAMQPQLASIRSAMQLMADRGETDTVEAKRLINEYRIATGKAKAPGVLDFLLGLPGLRLDDSSDHEDVDTPGGGGMQQVGRKRTAAAAAGSSAAAAAGARGSGKILVFGYHHETLNVLQSELCEKHDLGYIRIDGGTSPEVRNQMVHKFQYDPAVRVGLLSIKAAGTGLTLTAADRVVFAELHWNPSDLNQAEDRIHRMGQEQHCMIYYCMAANSADDLMWGTIVRKLRIVGAAVDGREVTGGSSSQGLGHLETWSQQVQGSQGGHGSIGSPAGAAAGDNMIPAASQQQQGLARSQEPQQRLDGADPAAAAAAAGGNISRRRRLFDQFEAEAAGTERATQFAGPPSGAEANLHDKTSGPAAGGATVIGSSTPAAAATVAGGSGNCDSIDPAGDDHDDAPARSQGLASSGGDRADPIMLDSEPGHLTGTTAPVAAADSERAGGEAVRQDQQQQQQGGDGSQAGGGPPTQGSQSTMAVGEGQDGGDELAAKRLHRA